jgi:hypothetical protein
VTEEGREMLLSMRVKAVMEWVFLARRAVMM